MNVQCKNKMCNRTNNELVQVETKSIKREELTFDFNSFTFD